MATIIKSNGSSVNTVNGFFKLKKSPTSALDTNIITVLPLEEASIVGGVFVKGGVESTTYATDNSVNIKWASEDGYILYKPSSSEKEIQANALLLNSRIPFNSGCTYQSAVIDGINTIDGYTCGSNPILRITGNFVGGKISSISGELILYPFGNIMLDWDVFPDNTTLVRCEFAGGVCFNWDKFWDKMIPSQTQKNYNIKPVGRFIVPNDHVFDGGYAWGFDLTLCKSDSTSVNNLIKSIYATEHDDMVMYKVISGARRYATSDVDDEIAALRTRGWQIT